MPPPIKNIQIKNVRRNKMKKFWKILVPVLVIAAVVGCVFAFAASADGDATVGKETETVCWQIYGSDGNPRDGESYNKLYSAVNKAHDGDVIKPLFNVVYMDGDPVIMADSNNETTGNQSKTVTIDLGKSTVCYTASNQFAFNANNSNVLNIRGDGATVKIGARSFVQTNGGADNSGAKITVDGVNVVSDKETADASIIVGIGAGTIEIRNCSFDIFSGHIFSQVSADASSLVVEDTRAVQRGSGKMVMKLESLIGGGTATFTRCTLESYWRIASLLDKKGSGVYGGLVTITDTALLCPYDTCDTGIRMAGARLVLNGKTTVSSSEKAGNGMFYSPEKGYPSMLEIADGVGFRTLKGINQGSEWADGSADFTKFGLSLKYADHKAPYVYGSTLNDGVYYANSTIGIGPANFYDKGYGVLTSEADVFGNTYDKFFVPKGLHDNNAFISYNKDGVNGIDIDGDYRYYIFEADFNTGTTYPDEMKILIEGRNADSLKWFGKLYIYIRNVDGGVEFYARLDGRMVGNAVKVPAGEWAHFTYVIDLKPGASESDPAFNSSVGAVFVNGQLVVKTEGVYSMSSAGTTLAKVGDLQIDANSNINRAADTDILIDNVRLALISRASGISLDDTVFADTPVYECEYLGREEIKLIPDFIVGEMGFATLDAALQYASENGGTVVLMNDVVARTVINTPCVINMNGHEFIYDSETCNITRSGDTLTFTEAAKDELIRYEIYADENDAEAAKTIYRPIGALIRIDDEIKVPAARMKDGTLMVCSGWKIDGESMTATRATQEHRDSIIYPAYTAAEGDLSAAVAVMIKGGAVSAVYNTADELFTAVQTADDSATFFLLSDMVYKVAADPAIRVSGKLHLDMNGHTIFFTRADGFTGTTYDGVFRVSGAVWIYSTVPGAKLVYHSRVAGGDGVNSGILFMSYNTDGVEIGLGVNSADDAEGESAYAGNLSFYGSIAARLQSSNGGGGTHFYANGVNFYHTANYDEGIVASLVTEDFNADNKVYINNCLFVSLSAEMNGRAAVFSNTEFGNVRFTVKNSTIISDGNIINAPDSFNSTYLFEDCRIVGALTVAKPDAITLSGKILLAGEAPEGMSFIGSCGLTPDVNDADKELTLTLLYNGRFTDEDYSNTDMAEVVKSFAFTMVTGHTYGEWTATTPATCTADGTEERECSACHEKETRPIGALGHTWGEWTVKTPATCTENGTEEHECSVCHEKETRPIEATGHTWGEWEVTKAATCSEEGTKIRECSVCHVTETESIAKIAHTEGEWTVKTPATCEEDGEEHKLCTVCKEELETRVLPKLGHDMTDWVVTKEATCTEKGIKTKTCKHEGCTHKETEEIPMKAHTESGWIIDKKATESEEGTKHKECTVCHTKLGDSVAIAKIVASIDEGAKEWSKKSETLPTIKFNDSVSDITEVKVNGETVDPKNYTVKSGELTFTKEYLETLKAGEYTVEAVSATGNANASFTVKGGANVVLIVVLIVVGVIIVGGAVAFVIIKKKRA